MKTEEQIGDLVTRYVTAKKECEELNQKLRNARNARDVFGYRAHKAIREHFGKEFASYDAAVDAWQWGIGR